MSIFGVIVFMVAAAVLGFCVGYYVALPSPSEPEDTIYSSRKTKK